MADDPGQELADLEEEMEDRHSSYWQGPQAAVKQERALELYSAEEAMVPAPPRVRERRLSEIEAAMASRDGEYWHDQAMRDEYLHLLEGEDAGAAEAGDAPLEAVVALALDLGLPEDEANAIVAELSVLGVNDGEAAAGARRIELFKLELGTGFETFEAEFDRWPDLARGVFYANFVAPQGDWRQAWARLHHFVPNEYADILASYERMGPSGRYALHQAWTA